MDQKLFLFKTKLKKIITFLSILALVAVISKSVSAGLEGEGSEATKECPPPLWCASESYLDVFNCKNSRQSYSDLFYDISLNDQPLCPSPKLLFSTNSMEVSSEY